MNPRRRRHNRHRRNRRKNGTLGWFLYQDGVLTYVGHEQLIGMRKRGAAPGWGVRAGIPSEGQ